MTPVAARGVDLYENSGGAELLRLLTSTATRQDRLSKAAAASSMATPQLVSVAEWLLVMALGTLCALLPPHAHAGETSPFVEGAQLERVATVVTHAEGPELAPDGTIYFCDLTVTKQSRMEAGAIYAFDPRSGSTHVVLSPSGMASGIKFDGVGNMFVAAGADLGSRAIIRTDAATHRARFVATEFQGRRLNSPNDLAIDARGRIFFSDPRYFGDESVEQAIAGVYRIDADGSLHLVTGTMTKPNGIALAPDAHTLYVSNNDNAIFDRGRQGSTQVLNGPMQIVAFDLDARGEVSNRRVFADFGRNGGPDGIAVDRDGNVWAAVPDKEQPGVYVFDSEGNKLGFIATPEAAYNVLLVNGDDGNWLYITAGAALYRVRVTAVPFRPAAGVMALPNSNE